MVQEMIKLRALLDEKGIKWEDKSSKLLKTDISLDRTHFKIDGKLVSVINGYGTYGGDEGLLEVMIFGEDPVGWLTAEEVIELLSIMKESEESNNDESY